jgi:ATP-dependent Zn protease
MLRDAAAEARKVIEEHSREFEGLVQRLMQNETIERPELVTLLGPSVDANGPGEGDAVHFGSPKPPSRR